MPAHGNSAKLVFQSLVFIIVCVFFLAALRANADLAVGRYALFMDERITFDGVRQILHPDDLDSFLWAVADGGDHRYGRSLWNTMAMASFLPDRFWGDAGQIVAARMLQACLVLAACLVFAFGLLRSWPLRVVLLAALLAMPYADYFMTMPKPEPLQLLFLAMFSVCFFRRRFLFGSHWIFLGLAFGTKISALPAVFVFAAVSLLAARRAGRSGAELFEQATAAIVYFLAGVAIAVPIFVEPVLLIVAGYVLLLLARGRLRMGIVAQSALIVAGLGCLFLEYRPLFDAWIKSTFQGTAHGADQAGINAWSWTGHFFQDWLIAPAIVGIGAFAAAAAFVAMKIADLRRQDAETFDRNVAGLSLIAAGAAWNLSIFLVAHRLWGFYLFPGTALAIVGLLVLADASVALSGDGMRRSAGYGVAIATFAVAAAYWAPRTFANLDALASRTVSDEYLAQQASYATVVGFLEQRAASSSKRLRVAYDPALFPPQSNARYRIVEFWGPYNRWDESPDVIVLGIRHTPAGKPVPRDSPAYPDYLAERQGYARYVVGKADKCPEPRCFRRELTLPSGSELLVLSN